MIEAQAQLNSSKFQAQAREAEAEAKGIAARQEEAKIRFEQRLRLTEIDAKLAQTGTTSSSLLQLLACCVIAISLTSPREVQPLDTTANSSTAVLAPNFQISSPPCGAPGH